MPSASVKPSTNKPKIALVSPTLGGGGVNSTVRFLRDAIQESGRYECSIVSLATSVEDEASVRLLAPVTWLAGVRITRRDWEGQSVMHVGARLVEFEFQRYKPRAALRSALEGFALIQLVSGFPAIARAFIDFPQPVCAFVATRSSEERASQIGESAGLRKVWLKLMTNVNSHFESVALPRLAHVFAESAYTKDLLSSYVEPTKLSIAVPGVDTTRFCPKADFPTDGYILSVGRLSDPRKNIRLLIEAYGMLRLQMGNAPRLVVAGLNPPTIEDWDYAAALGLVDLIDVRTRLSAEELADLYRGATLFVLPSNEEGLGIVLLEAMASGVPVVSTRCGGPETIVEEEKTGLLVPVRNAEALAERMQMLLEAPGLRRKMGRKAREVVEKNYSMIVAGQRYLDVYDRLLVCRT